LEVTNEDEKERGFEAAKYHMDWLVSHTRLHLDLNGAGLEKMRPDSGM
jgi:hypothetical protein